MFFVMYALALATPVVVPHTRVRLEPPDGYRLATSFTGFTDGGRGTIQITELRGVPREQMQTEMSAEALATKGMTEIERIWRGSALLIHLTQGDGAATLEKWTWIGGDDESAVLVVGTVPPGDPSGAAIRHALESVELLPRKDADAAVAPEPVVFAITPAGDLAPAGTLETLQLFTPGGRSSPLPDGAPRFMAGPVAAPEPELDRFATARLRALPFQSLQELHRERVVLAGRGGVEITARGVHPRTKDDVWIYQLVLEDVGGGFFVAVGIGGERHALTGFRSMGRSVRFDLDGGAATAPPR